VRRRRWSTRLIIAGSALLLTAGAITATALAQASQTSYYSFFTGVDTSRVQPDPDRQPNFSSRPRAFIVQLQDERPKTFPERKFRHIAATMELI